MRKIARIMLGISLFLVLSAFSKCPVDKDEAPGAGIDDTAARAESVPIQPTAGFLSRKARYLQYCNDENPPGSGGLDGQVCRAYMGSTIDEAPIYDAIANKINPREDTADFSMTRILRILMIDRRNGVLPATLREDMKQAVLNFKYWLDEPGPDTMCWWSENHQNLFHSCELLAGLLYPDEIFPNSGMTGREHAEHARRLIHEWLDRRGRFGFSEFHSNVYFNEDIPPLTNLVDFADEESIRVKAAMVLDVIAYDVACNYYRGLFATTHGRTYPGRFVGGLSDSITEWAWIMLGNVDIASINDLSDENFSGSSLATSDYYWPPAVLENIAQDSRFNLEHKQRDSIKLADGPYYGISYDDYEDVMFWWGMTGYLAPETIEGSWDLIEYYNLWEGYQWKDLAMLRGLVGQRELVGVATDVEPMARGATLEEVSTYTYRTPYYQLSGAQDWKKFKWSGQATVWLGTIDKYCFVFTSFPGAFPLAADFGSDWTGGFLPRATFYKNVGVIQYHMPVLGDLEEYLGSPIPWDSFLTDVSHAYFPRNEFDEVLQTGNWVIGRKEVSYLALYSETPTTWAGDNDYELISSNTDNVWIVEMGDYEHNGPFADFVSAIENSTVDVGATVHYTSPSLGLVEVGWYGPMRVNGQDVDIGPYARWDNPYSYQVFGTTVTEIEFGGRKMKLDFDKPKRSLWEMP